MGYWIEVSEFYLYIFSNFDPFLFLFYFFVFYPFSFVFWYLFSISLSLCVVVSWSLWRSHDLLSLSLSIVASLHHPTLSLLYTIFLSLSLTLRNQWEWTCACDALANVKWTLWQLIHFLNHLCTSAGCSAAQKAVVCKLYEALCSSMCWGNTVWFFCGYFRSLLRSYPLLLGSLGHARSLSNLFVL